MRPGYPGYSQTHTNKSEVGSIYMSGEIRAFLSQCRDAFNRLDGEAVTRLYAAPSGIADCLS